MTLWPPDWSLIFGIVTFIVASVAVRGWRDLGMLVLLMALLILPLKRIGVMIGFHAMAADAVTWHLRDGAIWKVEFKPTWAFALAAPLASLVILAWKRTKPRAVDECGS